MKEVFLLTKILFKSSINSNSQKKMSPLKFLGWALLYLYIAGVIGFLSFEMISALQIVNQEAVFLNLCLMIVLGMNIMRSLFTSINMLFFSKDTEYLLPLPVKAYKIVMAKINCLIISEYIMCLIILLPALLVYGYVLNLSLWFYIVGILVMLLIPIVPIALVSLIMTIIMKFTNIIRNKDFVQYITIVLTLILIIGVQFLTGMDQQITNEQFANMLVETNGLVQAYTKYFFTLKPAMQALIKFNSVDGILSLGLLAIQTVVIYIAVIYIMSKFYIKTVTNVVASASTKRKENKEKSFKKKPLVKSYVKKEFQILVRNPIFFMQCVLPSFLFPLIFLIPVYMGITGGDAQVLDMLKVEIANGISSPSGIAISVSILIFLYMFNYISITSISRDGENAVFMKYIPIPLEKQCLYKILPGIIMNIVPAIYLTIILKVLLPGPELNQTLLWINLVALFLNILNNYWMIIIDLKRPKLHWTTEYAVVKQNMNMLWEMVIYIFEILILIFWGTLIHNVYVFVFSVCLLLILAIKHIQKYIHTNENKLFEKII